MFEFILTKFSSGTILTWMILKEWQKQCIVNDLASIFTSWELKEEPPGRKIYNRLEMEIWFSRLFWEVTTGEWWKIWNREKIISFMKTNIMKYHSVVVSGWIIIASEFWKDGWFHSLIACLEEISFFLVLLSDSLLAGMDPFWFFKSISCKAAPVHSSIARILFDSVKWGWRQLGLVPWR